ncbi:MAG: hypothetical protein RIQ89_681 [Bacteroidota bacterium]|jgi:uncharacterized protein
MPYLDKYLKIKKSQIAGAGLGLFTTIDIKKGTRITEYAGALKTWKVLAPKDGYNAYIFKLNSRWGIDGAKKLKSFGRYANDATGPTRTPGLRNNCCYETVKLKCFLDASRNIKAGSELLVPYGGNFWQLVKKINQLEDAKSKKANRKV